ncbi:MAG: nucleotidyltransferase [Bdellovibrio sp.]|nr:MAG: nucleotidyltransferase [Bdellovibrio sp.]
MNGKTKSPDIRWKQRFTNFKKALNQLVEFQQKGELSKLEEQGFIKAFEYTFELSWNTIKDFYESQGEVGLQGSRDAFRLAFKRGLIENGETWMAMIQSRIQTAHTHNEASAQEVVRAIRKQYVPLFQKLAQKLSKISKTSKTTQA